jgi:DNA repair exonuclease SbcCD ATPase subunit
MMEEQQQTVFEMMRQERDRAIESATRWRRCYEVEAQQRRKDTENLEQQVHKLRAEVQQVMQVGATVAIPKSSTILPPAKSDEHGQVVRLLTAEITKLRQECERLTTALAQEKLEHEQTRSNFITALGDVMQQGKVHTAPASQSKRS